MINQDIISLIELRDKAHILHWETRVFSQHKALGKFYDELTELLDTFVETYMGKYGRMNLNGLINVKVEDVDELMDETYVTLELMEPKIDKKCTDLLNILADMKELVNRTKYMLTLK